MMFRAACVVFVSLFAAPELRIFAAEPGSTSEGEAGRAVFLALSADEGATFAPEREALRESTGACGCCGMRAHADAAGNLFVSYRGARATGNRDQILAVARPGETTGRVVLSAAWKIATCPMSSTTFAPASNGVVAAWESEGNVHWTRIDPVSLEPGPVVSVAGRVPRKHPAVAGNARGEVLLAWSEGTSWGKGGALSWQVFDSTGKAVAEPQRAEGLPVWSLPAVWADRDGKFHVIF